MKQTSLSSFFSKPASSSPKKENVTKANNVRKTEEIKSDAENSDIESAPKKRKVKKAKYVISSEDELSESPVTKESVSSPEPEIEKKATTDTKKKAKAPAKKIKKVTKVVKKESHNKTNKDESTVAATSSIETEEIKTEEVKSEEIKTDEIKTKEIETEEIKTEEDIPKVEEAKLHPFFNSESKEKDPQKFPDAAALKNGIANYYATHLKKVAPIGDNNNLPYSDLCKVFSGIEATTKRLEKLAILTEFFLRVFANFSSASNSTTNITTCLYLCINRIAPDYEGIELGIGESVLMKAVAEATGRTLANIKKDVAVAGDLGVVAQESRSNQGTLFKPKPLTVAVVFKTLKEIATITGNSSMQKKIDKIKFLLVSCRDNEAKFLMRSLEGKLRIGLAEKTVLIALAHASVLHQTRNSKISRETLEKKLSDASEYIKTAFSELPNYEKLASALSEHGYEELEKHCKLTPGIPVKPMLAHPTKAISEVLTRFEGITFTCEYKYDGERAQLHLLEDGSIHIYSRNSENMTQKYPDISRKISEFTNDDTKSFVLDCEAVAWDREEKKILPFQVLSTRKRKDVKEEDIKVQVVIFAFDLLFLNGQSLLRHSFFERRRLMYSAFKEIDGIFTFAKNKTLSEVEDIQIFLDESIADNCEGLMVKTLEGNESSYEPSKRSRNWLKVKKDYLSGVGDSLDLVVIGAYIGRGKRTGVYGGYLLACYDPESEEYQSICKIGTGFSDEILDTHHKSLQAHIIDNPKSYYNVDLDSTKPDVWFEPSQVWEVKAADLSVSPIYKAAFGKVDSSKGISLRFPRFIRIRDDKSPENATDSSQVADLYNQQAVVNQKTKTSEGFADDDFDY